MKHIMKNNEEGCHEEGRQRKRNHEEDRRRQYTEPAGRGLVGVELLLTAWLTGAMVWAAYQGLWASVPFLGLFAGGYGAVGIFSLLSKIGNNAKPTLGSQVTHQSHTGSDQVSAIGS